MLLDEAFERLYTERLLPAKGEAFLRTKATTFMEAYELAANVMTENPKMAVLTFVETFNVVLSALKGKEVLCSFLVVWKAYSPYLTSFGIKKRSPYAYFINKVVKKGLEVGIFKHSYDRWGTFEPVCQTSLVTPIGMEKCGGVAVVLMCTMIFACLLAAIEKVAKKFLILLIFV